MLYISGLLPDENTRTRLAAFPGVSDSDTFGMVEVIHEGEGGPGIEMSLELIRRASSLAAANSLSLRLQ